jgi:hypothetical protein
MLKIIDGIGFPARRLAVGRSAGAKPQARAVGPIPIGACGAAFLYGFVVFGTRSGRFDVVQ